ncbi:uncharacterized protein EDB93DRAFT_1107682 [Suillus bovinus]|uniref:uncharacterized protein n=1 Tax=Suillus bovinus TaxID=48563 RepID=UPI001B87E3E0|nr:uncharacterized protein EDB93DRAFT_1107682 [Suillus bovinus]KAG2133223.1 hypothetical protein EDB93DRAFT_1107682 [Suillus bovinus]
MQDDTNNPPAIDGCSLRDFNSTYIEIIAGPDLPLGEYYRGCILGLTGKDILENIQYSIEATRNKFQAPREVTVVRDYDSFLSFTNWLPVKADLFLYPINNPVDTLHSSLHFKVPMSIKDGQADTPMPPHRIPNICLAAAGIRTKVRLFFPRLYDPERKDVELTFEEKKALYEKGLLPVLRNLSPDTVTNWPVNYEGAQTRARKTRGMFQYSTRPFSGSRVRRFGHDLVEEMVTAFPWAEGMLFMVQLQGVKEAHQHHPDDMDRAEDALANTLSDFYFDELMDEEHCYVDVGLELSEPGYAFQWRTDAHRELLLAFTQMTGAQTRSLLKSRDYAVDYSSGLIQLAGCRVSIPPRNNTDPVYFQAYTTDKALIQQKDGGRHGLVLTGKAALDEVTPPYLKHLFELYYDAKDVHDCAARVEVRIRARDALTHALDFPGWLMTETLCVFPRLDWWQWRCVRLQSIIRTLRLQNQGPPELRFTSPALTLTAGLMWLANGLHSRPDDGSAARDLMCAILPVTHDYDADGIQIVPRQHHIDNHDGLPFCAHGAFFLREMVFPPIADVPRMKRTNVISHTSYKYFFGCDFNVLRNRYHPTAYIPRSMIPKSRVNTQKGMSKRHKADIPEPSAAFADLEYHAPRPPQDIGDDLPFDERLDLPPGLDEAFAVTITKHWNQFCSDVLQKCGNMKGNPLAPSHCRLSMHERLVVTDDIYRETNLALIFNRVQWKRAHPLEWREAFDQFFIPPGTAPRLQPQNYPNMTYWMEWADMKRDKPAHVIDAIRTKYWALFKELYWIPKPYNDRLWKYTEDSAFTTLTSTYKSSAPHLLINPSRQPPRWVPEHVTGDALQEQEEEEEEQTVHDPDYVPDTEWVDNVPPVPMRIYMREEEEESGSDTA